MRLADNTAHERGADATIAARVTGPDPPPLNWSTLRYVFGHEEEDRNAEKAPQA